MKLKKCNAIISLLTILGMLVHVGYNAFAYLTFYYNPVLKTVTALPFMICTLIHAVLGMLSVFLQGDGTRLNTYAKQNVETVLQRVSAAFIFPMLFLHLKTFELLKNAATIGNWVGWWLLVVVEAVFFGTIFTHVAVSFSRALITLGWLTSYERKKILDRVVYVLCAIFFAVALFAVVKGQISMFMKMGG